MRTIVLIHQMVLREEPVLRVQPIHLGGHVRSMRIVETAASAVQTRKISILRVGTALGMHALFANQILNAMKMWMAATLRYLRTTSVEGILIIPVKLTTPVMGILIVMGIVTALMWQNSKKTMAAAPSTNPAPHV